MLAVRWCPNLIYKSNSLPVGGSDGSLPLPTKLMTQLIAAIADSGQTAIGLSDRMVSTGDMTLGFESPNRKAEKLTERSAVLLAGSVHEPDLVRDARERVKGKDRIRDIAEECAQLYLKLRTQRIEDEVLRAGIGVQSFSEYHQKQQMLHESVVFDTNDKIQKYQLGLELILIGVDDRTHISHITNPGLWRSYDNLGYCTLGMGERHADNVFAWYKYSSATPLKEALYITFEAKKKSEMAGGIGPTTDAFIIKASGIEVVNESTLTALSEVYNEREFGAERRALNDRLAKLKLETRKLDAS